MVAARARHCQRPAPEVRCGGLALPCGQWIRGSDFQTLLHHLAQHGPGEGALALQRGGIEPGGIGNRRTGQQVEDFVQAKARHRQAEQAHEHFRQRFAGQRAGVGQGIGNEIVVPVAATEHGFDVRRVRVDVGGQHRDLARLQRRVEARIFQQAAQLVVQHLHFAQWRVAGMHLQAGITTIHFRT